MTSLPNPLNLKGYIPPVKEEDRFGEKRKGEGNEGLEKEAKQLILDLSNLDKYPVDNLKVPLEPKEPSSAVNKQFVEQLVGSLALDVAMAVEKGNSHEQRISIVEGNLAKMEKVEEKFNALDVFDRSIQEEVKNIVTKVNAKFATFEKSVEDNAVTVEELRLKYADSERKLLSIFNAKVDSIEKSVKDNAETIKEVRLKFPDIEKRLLSLEEHTAHAHAKQKEMEEDISLLGDDVSAHAKRTKELEDTMEDFREDLSNKNKVLREFADLSGKVFDKTGGLQTSLKGVANRVRILETAGKDIKEMNSRGERI